MGGYRRHGSRTRGGDGGFLAAVYRSDCVSERTELGKITRASFGLGGYQDAMIGVNWGFGGIGWGVSDFWGQWALRSENAKWTEAERVTALGRDCLRLLQILNDANKRTIDELVGVPVQVTFDGNILKSWRVLREVV